MKWLDKMSALMRENASYLRKNYEGKKWASDKARDFDSIADYLDEEVSELDEEADDDGNLDELDGTPPF
jgi:hypothetical protein